MGELSIFQKNNKKRLAEQAYKKYKHLEKHPERTEAKIIKPDGWIS